MCVRFDGPLVLDGRLEENVGIGNRETMSFESESETHDSDSGLMTRKNTSRVVDCNCNSHLSISYGRPLL
jgi:hypothetical protein